MSITQGGNIGVGTTTPSTLLTVQGSSPMLDLAATQSTLALNGVVSPGVRMTANANGGNSSFFTDGSASVYTTASSLGSYPFSEAGNLVLQSRSAGASRDIAFVTGTTPATRMIVDRNGNVGIGTTTPSSVLETYGSAPIITRALSSGLPYSSTQSAIQIGIMGGTQNAGAGPSFLFFGQDSGGNKEFMGRLSSIWENPTNGAESAGISFRVRVNSADATADTERMRILANGNVGIGTTTPGTKLTLADDTSLAGGIGIGSDVTFYRSGANQLSLALGGAERMRWAINNNTGQFQMVGDGSSSAPKYSWSTDTNTGMYLEGSDALAFSTNGTNRLTIGSTGNIGIGTTTPGSKLEVYTASNEGTLIGNQSSALSSLGLSNVTSGVLFRRGSDGGATNGIFSFNDVGGIPDLGVRTRNDFAVFNNTTQTLTVKASGNVGIGTTTPEKTLHVRGSFLLDNANFTGLDMRSDRTTLTQNIGGFRFFNYLNAEVGGLFGTVGGDLTFSAGGTGSSFERIKVLGSNGNVGIGTTTPSAKLDIVLPAISGREEGIKITTSDDSGSRFDIFNGTAGAGSFAPLFSGHTDEAGIVPLAFSSSVVSAADTGSTNMMTFVARTATEPINGSYATVTTRPLFAFQNHGTRIMTMLANANVGIGSSTPVAKLSVTGAGTGTGLAFQVTDSANSPRLTVLDNGNVGVGVESATSKLEVRDAIGTAYSGTTNPTSNLWVYNRANSGTDGAFSSIKLQASNNGGNSNAIGMINVVQPTNGSSDSNFAFQLRNSAGNYSEVMRMLADGNVGIGTTTPGAKLDILGTGIGLLVGADLNADSRTNNSRKYFRMGSVHYANGEEPMAIFTSDSSSTYNALQFGGGSSMLNAATQIEFLTAANSTTLFGTSRMTINSSGNVGIGTTTPSSRLTIEGTNSSTGGLQINSTSGTFSRFAIYGSGGDSTILQNLGSTNGVTAFTNSSGTEIMRLMNSGNVGIGTTSPIAKLTVVGETLSSYFTATSTTATSSIAGSFDVANGAIRHNYATGLTSIDNIQLGNMNFEADSGIVTWVDMPVTSASAAGVKQSYTAGINGNPLLTVYAESDGLGGIQNSGVGIGTSTPLAKLDIWGNFRVSTSTSTASPLVFADTATGMFGLGTSSPTAQLHTTGTIRFSNFGSGNLTTDASGNVSVSSDERLKDVSGSFNRGLEDLKKISPILYKWNATSGLDMADVYAGFSAQNVETAIPEAVGMSPNGYLSLNDRPILAATVNAIKELAMNVASSTERMVSAENRIASLELAVAGLSAGSSTVVGTTSASSTIETVSGWLASLGAAVENAVARFVAVIADSVITKKLKVGDASNLAASGITIFDRFTGEPVCMYVENGVMKNELGECGAGQIVTPPLAQPEPTPEPEDTGENATSTPLVVESEGDTGTSTPDVTPEPEAVPEAEASTGDDTATTTPDVVVESEPETTPEPEIVPEAEQTPTEPETTQEEPPVTPEEPSEPEVVTEPESDPVAVE